MEDLAIQIDHVSKIYKLYEKPSDRMKEALGFGRHVKATEKYALNDVSFDVKRGETVGIIGTNGSGKSTILKIITGVLNPSMGNVNINGRISALLELGAGFNMEYNGIENVYLNGTMIGFSKEEIDAKLNDILAFADIGEYVYQPVKTYSSGMFVRLAFAVAINIDPEILIVDEALSVGDVFFQSKCYHKFEEFKKLGKTILFVSHDLSSISKYCDRVVLLNQGVKLAEGGPKEMIDLYKKVLVNQVDESDLEEFKEDDAEDSLIANAQTESEDPAGSTQKPGKKNKKKSGGKKNAMAANGQSAEGRVLWKDSLTLNPALSEYGSKLAEIEDFAMIDDQGNITNSLIKGSVFTVKMRIRFHETVQEPIFAYTIKNLKGEEITGTNSMLEHVDTQSTKDGDVYEISYEQEMNLQGGEYLMSFGCTGYHDGNFTVYHRLYDVCNITVISDKDSVGYYDMNAKVSMTKNGVTKL
ncbi:MAG: ABC transporter ATP-binding protein [Lachnospiraceae bacterium]|jgi:teichoic acid transport system ATP-binding protein|nr:ABC transporter ATP-binding protein [Lachnospiraceae bacterium]